MTFVRTHNIEHEYYDALAKKSNGFKKLFFSLEAKKLKRFEMQLKLAKQLLCITKSDLDYFQNINKHSFLLQPSFEQKQIQQFELANYALFHGNLSVEENEEAAFWIIENVWSNHLNLPLINFIYLYQFY